MRTLKPFQRTARLGLTRICVACAMLVSAAASEVGCPLKHGQWEPFPALTDEFDNGTLDASKWFPNNPSWLGRQPAYFNPKNVRVADGMLHLDAKKESLSNLPAGYHTYTTAFVKGKTTVRYGYHAVGVDVRPLAAKLRGTVEVWELPSEGGSPVRVTVRH